MKNIRLTFLILVLLVVAITATGRIISEKIKRLENEVSHLNQQNQQKDAMLRTLNEQTQSGKKEVDDTKKELDNTKQELENIKQELVSINKALDIANKEMEIANKELDIAGRVLDTANKVLDSVKEAVDNLNKKFGGLTQLNQNHRKNKRIMQALCVGKTKNPDFFGVIL